ncbi:MAG: hypothetical protein ABIQ81_05735 [Novosphingobium sp.]
MNINAMVGALGVISMLAIPVAGRMTDLFGSRRVALVGIISYPLTFIAFSQMNGSLPVFAILTLVQTMFAGVNDHFRRYIGIAGCACVIGSIMFLFLHNARTVGSAPDLSARPAAA